MLTLRLRLPAGPSTVKIEKGATFAQLRALVAETAKSPEEELTLSTGFPPTPLLLDSEALIAEMLHDMDTVVVSVSASTGQAVATGKLPTKRQKKAVEAKKGAAPSGGGGSSSCVRTISDLGSSSGSPAPPSSTKKRAPPSSSGGGGGGGGKRRAAALQLSSEEGIGSSLLGAVSGRKGASHTEDPASAFLKAASQSALVHHMEEVLANERFQARPAPPLVRRAAYQPSCTSSPHHPPPPWRPPATRPHPAATAAASAHRLATYARRRR